MLEAKILHSRGRDMLCLAEYSSTQVRGRRVAVFKHGFCGHKIAPHRMMTLMGHRLSAVGCTVVRFDCVGSGDSEGDEHDMTISGDAEDYRTVLRWVQAELRPQKTMLLGYSMGGLETALCCREIPVEGVVLWSPCSAPAENFRHILGSERFERGRAGEAVELTGDRVAPEFFRDLTDPACDPLRAVHGFEKPFFLLHGTEDTDVLPQNSRRYLEVLPQARLHLVEGAGHDYGSRVFQEELFGWTQRWAVSLLDL